MAVHGIRARGSYIAGVSHTQRSIRLVYECSHSSLLRQTAPPMALFQCCGYSTTLPGTWTKEGTSDLVHLLCTWSPGMRMCLTSWTFARTQERRSRCVCVFDWSW